MPSTLVRQIVERILAMVLWLLWIATIREWSHNDIDRINSHNDSKTFDIFEVNSQGEYNRVGGPAIAVPIVGYHRIDNDKTRDSTDVSLFAQEMKYLHDNGFRD